MSNCSENSTAVKSSPLEDPPAADTQAEDLLALRKEFLRHPIYGVLLGLFLLVAVGIYFVGRDGKKKKKKKKPGEKTRPPPRQRAKLNTPRDKMNKQFDGIFSNEIKFGTARELSMSL